MCLILHLGHGDPSLLCEAGTSPFPLIMRGRVFAFCSHLLFSRAIVKFHARTSTLRRGDPIALGHATHSSPNRTRHGPGFLSAISGSDLFSRTPCPFHHSSSSPCPSLIAPQRPFPARFFFSKALEFFAALYGRSASKASSFS